MAPLMILNPRKKKAGGKKRRRKMTAKQLKFFGPKKNKKKKRRAKATIIEVNANPRRSATVAKKKRRHRRHKKKLFSVNPRRRFRRNPRMPGAGLLHNTIVPAAMGAAGAIGVDLLLGNLPIPPAMLRGPMLPIVKLGAALLIGMAVGAVSKNKESGEEAAAGAFAVTLYGLGRPWLMARMPNLQMSRYVPMNGMQRYIPMNGMGMGPPARMFRPAGGGMRGMGYMSPARVGAGPNRAQMRFMSTN